MTGEYQTELRSKGSAHKVTIEDIYEEPEDYNSLGIDSAELLIDAGTPESPGGSGTGPREPPRQAWEELSRSDEGGGGASYGVLGGRSVMLPSTNRAAAAKPASVEDLTDLSDDDLTHSSRSEEVDASSYDVEEIFLNELAAGMASDDVILEEDTWYDALEEQDTSPPDVAKQLLTHLLMRATLLTSKHLLERATAVTDIWQQVSGIYTDKQLTAFAKVERLAQLLHQQQHIVPSDWREVIRQVLDGFELIHELQRISLGDEAKTVERIKRGIVQLQRLLDQPLVKRTLPQSVQQTLSASLPPILQTIASLQAFAALPESAPFEDYLDVVKRVLTDRQMGGDLAPRVLIESITRVEQLFLQVKDVLTSVSTGVHEVGELQASFPGLDASFDLKMAWLSQVMDTPSLLAVLRRQLSPETLTLLQQILPWLRQLNSYPADSALGQQAAWLLQQLNDPAAQALIQQSPLQPVIEQIKQQFAGDSTSLALFQALLQLTDPNQSVRQKLQRLIAPLVSRQSLGQAIRGAISYGTGYGPVLDVWDWYWRQPSGLSWEETLNRFIEELQAHPEHLTQLLPPSLQSAAKTVGWLRQFPRGGSWQETLQWAAKSAQKVPQLQWLYNRFIELSLAKAVYGALQHTERSVQEEALRQVAQDLGQYWPGLAETGGGLLTAMIPLLPGLLGISRDIYRLPPADSWLEWINHVMRIIQKTDSPALQQLGQQLESMIANRFVEGLSVGLDSAGEAASAAWSASTSAVDSAVSQARGAAEVTGAALSTAATTMGSVASQAGTRVAEAASWTWGAVTNMKDPLTFLGAEAAPISILPTHIVEQLESNNPKRAAELFHSATESNQQSLLKDSQIAEFINGSRSVSTEPDVDLSTTQPRTGGLVALSTESAAEGHDSTLQESRKVYLEDIEQDLKDLYEVLGISTTEEASNRWALALGGGGSIASAGLLILAAYLAWKNRQSGTAEATNSSVMDEVEECIPLEVCVDERDDENEATPALANEENSISDTSAPRSKLGTLKRYKKPLIIGGGVTLALTAACFYYAFKESEEVELTSEQMKIVFADIFSNEDRGHPIHRKKRSISKFQGQYLSFQTTLGVLLGANYPVPLQRNLVIFDKAFLEKYSNPTFDKYLIAMDLLLEAGLAIRYKDFYGNSVPGILIVKELIAKILATSTGPDVEEYRRGNNTSIWDKLNVAGDVALLDNYAKTLKSESSNDELYNNILLKMYPMLAFPRHEPKSGTDLDGYIRALRGLDNNIIIVEIVTDYLAPSTNKLEFSFELSAAINKINLSWRQMQIKNSSQYEYTPEEKKQLEILDMAKRHNATLLAERKKMIEVASLINFDAVRAIEKRGNYLDIANAKDMATSLSVHRTAESKALMNDQEFVNRAAAIIYKCIEHGNGSHLVLRGDPLQLLNEYAVAKQRLFENLFEDEGDVPDGYKTLTDFKRRGDPGIPKKLVPHYIPSFGGRRVAALESDDVVYNRQFAEYRATSSGYQAKVFTNVMLLKSGLTARQLASPIIKARDFRIAVGPKNAELDNEFVGGGKITLIQLEDRSMIFISSVGGEMLLKHVPTKDVDRFGFFDKFLTARGSTASNLSWRVDTNERFSTVLERLLGNASAIKAAVGSYYVGDRSASGYFMFNNRDEYYKLSGRKVSDVIATSLKQGLDSISESLRDAFEDLTETEKFFDKFPFVRQLRRKMSDPSYAIQWVELILEAVDLIMMVVSVGTAVNSSVRQLSRAVGHSVAKHRALGLRSIKLWRAVMTEVPSLVGRGLGRVAKALAEEIIECMQPLPIGIAMSSARSAMSEFGGGRVGELSYKFSDEFISTVDQAISKGALSRNYAINVNMASAVKGADDTRYHGTWRIEDKYYIVQDNLTYSVIWDSTNNTWRLANPERPGRFAYAVPVKFTDGRWGTHLDLAAKGGGKTNADKILGGSNEYINKKLDHATTHAAAGNYTNAIDSLQKAWDEAKKGAGSVELYTDIMTKAESILIGQLDISIEVPSVQQLREVWDKKVGGIKLTADERTGLVADINGDITVKTSALLNDFDSTVSRPAGFDLLSRLQEALATLPSHTVDLTYRTPEKLIAARRGYKDYSLSTTSAVREYTMIPAERQKIMQKAYRNELAFNRIYGAETAELLPASAAAAEDMFSLRLKKLPGKSLAEIMEGADQATINEVLSSNREKVISDLVNTLAVEGIVHNDINLHNIVYDPIQRKFYFSDFDDVDFMGSNALGERFPLDDTNIKRIQADLERAFNHFTVSTLPSSAWGPKLPTPHSSIPKERAAELKELANGTRTLEESMAKQREMTRNEGKYYSEMFSYNQNMKVWNESLHKGTQKYTLFYEGSGVRVDKSKGYNERYIEEPSQDKDALYINEEGDTASSPGKEVVLNVKGDTGKSDPYRFRVSDDGRILVVDNMYGNIDKGIDGAGVALPMNELQGEFIKSRADLLKNIEYVTQESVVNPNTQTILRAISSTIQRGLQKELIVLTPDGVSAAAFRVMLDTPNVQPTARMLSTYPEIGKQIVEIRIYGFERITMVLGDSRAKLRCRRGVADCIPWRKSDATKLAEGDITPLVKASAISARFDGDMSPIPSVAFEAFRYDDIRESWNGGQKSEFYMKEPLSTYLGDPAHYDKFHGDWIFHTTGDKVASAGKKKPLFGNNVRVIEVNNADAGTIALKMPLSRVTEANPIYFHSGDLSGCTMVYAVRGDMLYVYHAGMRSNAEGIPKDWTTGENGARTIAQSHAALTGMPVPEGFSGNYNGLADIFSEYDSSFITYLGKGDNVIGRTYSNVSSFDYGHIPRPIGDARIAYAGLLLIRRGDTVKVEAFATDNKSTIIPGETTRDDAFENFSVLDSKIVHMGEIPVSDFTELDKIMSGGASGANAKPLTDT